MCFGSKSSNTDPPPPSTPTTFDYQVANRGDRPPSSTAAPTPLATFGAELGQPQASSSYTGGSR